MWEACHGKTYLGEGTTTRMRMLAERYQLQSTHARYNQYTADPTCPLCLKEPETITHFLMECAVLEQTRRPKVSGILAQLEGRGLKTPTTAHEWCLTILNGGRLLQTTGVQLESRLTKLETACIRFCHTVHIERDTRIDSMLMDKF